MASVCGLLNIQSLNESTHENASPVFRLGGPRSAEAVRVVLKSSQVSYDAGAGCR